MNSFKHMCPHCGTKQAGFILLRDFPNKRRSRHWSALAECSVCGDIILANFLYLQRYQDTGPVENPRSQVLNSNYDLQEVQPSIPSPRIPRSIPSNVELPLREAESSYVSRNYSAAGSCYRKSLERSLKHLAPEAKGRLIDRIRSMKTILPDALVSLADEVRIFGNASMHEDDYDPTAEDCSAAREFIHLFLTYTFTLPRQVTDARAKAEAAKEG